MTMNWHAPTCRRSGMAGVKHSASFGLCRSLCIFARRPPCGPGNSLLRSEYGQQVPQVRDRVIGHAVQVGLLALVGIEHHRGQARLPRAEDVAVHVVADVHRGEIAVRRQGAATVFDFGEWKSSVATRKNDDGTISFFTIDPGVLGFEFVVGDRNGKRVLVLRDAQHEYVFHEA